MLGGARYRIWAVLAVTAAAATTTQVSLTFASSTGTAHYAASTHPLTRPAPTDFAAHPVVQLSKKAIHPAAKRPVKGSPPTTAHSSSSGSPTTIHTPATVVRTVSTAPATTTTAAPSSTSTTAASTTTTTTSPPAPTSGLTAQGETLLLNGQPYRDVGVNAYELATDWGTNDGCGAMLSNTQLDAFFASLPAHTLVRFWAWQGSMAVNVNTGQIDWAPLDRVFSAAAAHDDLLVVSLKGQGGSCDDNVWNDPAWYDGGYRTALGTDPSGRRVPLTYWQYVQAIVGRYASSPALGMWEPISEAEASTCPAGYSGSNCEGHQTCPDESAAASALRSFFDTVGSEVHSLDPHHLVESGLLGGGQCGTAWTDYQYVGASPGIDVLSVHDYYPGDQPIGGDQWNGVAEREKQAAADGKPLISGETGIPAGPGGACPSDSGRASEFSARIQAQSAIGIDAFLLWDWVPSSNPGCTTDIAAGDPSLALLGPF